MYPAVASLFAVLEIVAPVGLVLAAWWRLRPRHAAAGAALGAGGYFAAVVLKAVALAVGLAPILEDTHGAAHSLRSAALSALLGAGVEEILRFGIAGIAFRRATGVRPVRAALLFGLGWGGVESALIGASSLVSLARAVASSPGATVWPSLAGPLGAAAERASAMALHVALATVAVHAAVEWGHGRRGRAVAEWGAALSLHVAVDAYVRLVAIRYTQAAAAGDDARALSLIMVLESGFALASFGALLLALRVPSSGTRGSASPAP